MCLQGIIRSLAQIGHAIVPRVCTMSETSSKVIDQSVSKCTCKCNCVLCGHGKYTSTDTSEPSPTNNYI